MQFLVTDFEFRHPPGQLGIGCLKLVMQQAQGQVRFDAGQHLLNLKRFGNIIHASKCERLNLALGLIQRADKNNRNIAGAVVGF